MSKSDPIENLYAIKEYWARGYKPAKEEFMEMFRDSASEEAKEEEWVKFETEVLSKITEEDVAFYKAGQLDSNLLKS